MIQFACNLIIEETQDDCRLIHVADDIYHATRKQAKIRRSTRKNHRNCRAVTYTFQSDADAVKFMAEVEQEFIAKYPESVT